MRKLNSLPVALSGRSQTWTEVFCLTIPSVVHASPLSCRKSSLIQKKIGKRREFIFAFTINEEDQSQVFPTVIGLKILWIE